MVQPQRLTAEEKKQQAALQVEIMSQAMASQTKDPVVLKAAQFLVMRDARYTMEQIANEWKCDRKTVYNNIAKWRKEGQMEEAEKLYAVPKIEEISGALSDFMNSVPEMIERVKQIVLHSKSDKTALEAFAWAYANLIKPTTDAQMKAGAPESTYAKRPTDLNPTKIVVPDFIRKAE